MERTVQGAPYRPARLNQNPKAVRRLRMIAGYRQKALAKAVGVTPNHLCNIERGRRSASVDTLHRLADVLGRPVEELLAE
ncbi:hypothetical protein GCM10017673_39950 [Streptosporangium violaceochromogenes]|nr:hypothetical protein GCM10017673_39950 [Streptosporangium violaceochromogenes]